jgi:hypothetical protein
MKKQATVNLPLDYVIHIHEQTRTTNGGTMKKTSAVATSFICGLFIITGCTTIRVSQDYKPSITFSEMKTFAWKNAKQKKSGDVRIDSPFNDERIRAAVNKALTGKGYILSSNHADVYVSYDYSIRSKIASTSNGPVIGFGFGTGGRNSAIGLGVSTGNDVGQYDEGQLVIDLTDGITNDLLWRGTSTSRVDTQAAPERTSLLFNKMVEKNLAQFPPDKK